MDYTYLVTGADGHLGSWIIRTLKKEGKTVRGLRLPHSNLKTPILEEVYYGDITKPNTLNDFFNTTKAKVIHTAAIVSVSKKMNHKIDEVNINGTLNILKLCKEKKFPLTYVSSVHAFVDKSPFINENSIIDPNQAIGEYAKTKAIISLLLEKERKHIPINIVFPSGILGPKDYGKSPLNTVIKDYVHNKLFCYLEGGYDMVDVRDVASFIVKLNLSDIYNESFILSNKYIKIKDFINIISINLKSKKKPFKLPLSIAKFLAPMSEFYYNLQKKPALFSSYSLYTLEHSPTFSHQKATKLLNYTPRFIESSIKDILKEIIK